MEASEHMNVEIVIDDIPEKYHPVVDIVGLPAFIKLCKYVMGSKVYLPMYKTIESNAKRRKIIAEYDGYNVKELSDKYGLTPNMIKKIIRDSQNDD